MIEVTLHLEDEGIEVDVTVRSALEQAAAQPDPHQAVIGRVYRAAVAAFDGSELP